MVNKNQKNGVKGSGMGVGLVAVGAAVAAGYYFYVSGNAKKNRKMVTSWASSLKGEILNKATALKDNLNKESLMGIIDEVANTYYTAKNVSKEHIGVAVTELKKNWSKLLVELKNNKKSTKTMGSKTKATKKDSSS